MHPGGAADPLHRRHLMGTENSAGGWLDVHPIRLPRNLMPLFGRGNTISNSGRVPTFGPKTTPSVSRVPLMQRGRVVQSPAKCETLNEWCTPHQAFDTAKKHTTDQSCDPGEKQVKP